MTKVAVNEESLMDIANAIRTQNGTQTTYKPSEMGDAIEALQPTVDADAVTVTADNTTQHIYPDTGKYFDEVVVNPITPIVYPNYISFYQPPSQTIDLSWLRTDNITIMSSMFQSSNTLESLDVSLFNTENVTNMNSMFASLINMPLSSIVGLQNFVTSKVTNFASMFWRVGYNLSSPTNLADFSNFSFFKANTCAMMFQNCKMRKIILNSPNNPSLTNCQSMFSYSSLNEISLDNFDVSKVSNASGMFQQNSGLTNDSLNSIMQAFSHNTAISNNNKTLKYLGFSSSQASNMTTLENWSLLQANGWITGY